MKFWGLGSCVNCRVWIGCVVLGLSGAAPPSRAAVAPLRSGMFFDLVPKLSDRAHSVLEMLLRSFVSNRERS